MRTGNRKDQIREHKGNKTQDKPDMTPPLWNARHAKSNREGVWAVRLLGPMVDRSPQIGSPLQIKVP